MSEESKLEVYVSERQRNKAIGWIFSLGSLLHGAVEFCLVHSAECPKSFNSGIICCSFQKPVSNVLVIIYNIP